MWVTGPSGTARKALRRHLSSSSSALGTIGAAGLLLAATTLAPATVDAGIYKCVDGSGAITYSHSACALSERTANVLSNGGRKSSRFDCRLVEAFTTYTATAMKQGKTLEEVVIHYGGRQNMSRSVMQLLTDIYSFDDKPDSDVGAITERMTKSCSNGNFGVITCNALPPLYVNEAGACGARPDYADGGRGRSNSANVVAEQGIND